MHSRRTQIRLKKHDEITTIQVRPVCYTLAEICLPALLWCCLCINIGSRYFWIVWTVDSKLFEGKIRPFLHLMISGCIPQLFLWWCPWYAGPSTPGDGHHDGGDDDFGDDDIYIMVKCLSAKVIICVFKGFGRFSCFQTLSVFKEFGRFSCL